MTLMNILLTTAGKSLSSPPPAETVTDQQVLNSWGAAGRGYIKLIMILGGQNERQVSFYFLLSVPLEKTEYEYMKTIIPWRAPLSFRHDVSKNYNLYKSIIKQRLKVYLKGWQTFSGKDQPVNIFDLSGYLISVTSTQACRLARTHKNRRYIKERVEVCPSKASFTIINDMADLAYSSSLSIPAC